jgi:hypothetical protein
LGDIVKNVVDLGYSKEQIKEPFTIAFCYPKSGPVLVKGSLSSVKGYLLENIKGIYHYRLSHWRKGKKRGKWYVSAPPDNRLSFKETRRDGSKKYNLIFRQFGRDITVETFESIPHKYIENFDLFQVGI